MFTSSVDEVQDDARTARGHAGAPRGRTGRALLHLTRIHRDTQR